MSDTARPSATSAPTCSAVPGSPPRPADRTALISPSTASPSAEPRPMATRSVASVLRAIRQPSPGFPTTQSSGTNTSSRKTSLNTARPVISRNGRISIPLLSMSTRKNVSPRCLGAALSVRARQIAQSASRAREVHTFCPVSRHPPSVRSARVRSEARSEPASGSLNSWHQAISPRRVGPANRSRWACVPWLTMAGPAQPPITRSGRDRPARLSSSSMTNWTAGEAERP